MNVDRMLAVEQDEHTIDSRRVHDRSTTEQHPHIKEEATGYKSSSMASLRSYKSEHGGRPTRSSPTKKDQKHVVFQLIDTDPRIQARLPMRVMISPNDTTESICATIKNFYGLYDYGVSFEKKEGISIIAAYDNFEKDMTVFVRTVAMPQSINGEPRSASSPRKPVLGAPFEARSAHGSVHSPSRHAARSAGVRSVSPTSELDRRSLSGKMRKAKGSIHGDADGYSSDDGANASVTSSRRSKTEQVNAEISVDNIVEGGRRARAFESSELPLFVPPQMPFSASISSISPQRRTAPVYAGSPPTNQHTFAYSMPSPNPNGVALSYGANNYSAYYSQPRPMRARPSGTSSSRPGGIMPTPDPTVGSAISDEDVALQLMRLGDASNFSYGRTSTSTYDDALSGKAEACSSDEEDDEEGPWSKKDAGPQRKKQRITHEYSSEASSGDEAAERRGSKSKKSHDHKSKSRPSMTKLKTKSVASTKVPISPASLAPHSRKASVASSAAFPLGPDEEDLSSKPRCQRCRKSKKGCDRQRPCGRCKDAGIGVDGCVSEDEGNGRKGRYGRHMGVPVKKDEEMLDIMAPTMAAIPNGGYFLAPAPIDKSKKRKR